MSDLKTKPNDLSVDEFINSIENETKRKDSQTLLKLMQELTHEPAVMWGDSLIGFGSYHYKYRSGREGDWFLAGFSPRKQNMTIYIVGGFENQQENLAKIGKAKTSVSCLYIKKLADIDVEVLKEMILKSIETVKKRYANVR